MQGRVVLITGANTGIGRFAARELARRGARVFAAGLSRERTQPLMDDVAALPGATPIEWMPLDLASLASVRDCAQAFVARGLPLHVLVNNAGLAGRGGVTKDGFEIAFGVNHLGHFLLTHLLLDTLRASGPARVVTVASRAHYRSKGLEFDALRQGKRTRTGITEYSDSKLANVLFSAELARRLGDGSALTTYSLHPGVVATDVWRHVPWPLRSLIKLRGMITPEEGAQTTLHCACAPQLAGETGLYYDQCQPKTPSALAQDAALARELWRRSEDWVRPFTG